jgi:hypothetical protein
MTKSKSKIGNFDIGYGRPPVYSQFKPNQSGNPKGRPKKESKSSKLADIMPNSEQDELLRAQLERTVSVTEGSKSKKMKMREVISQAQINAAAKGNVFAQREVLKAARELELRDAQRRATAEEAKGEEREAEIRVYHAMVKKREERARIWAEAEARGAEPDQPWPHPDDILLFPETMRWRPRGPFSSADVVFYEYCRAQRDYMFAAYVREFADKKRPAAWRNLHMLFWVNYDILLPLRWQLVNNAKQEVTFFNLSILTNKQLQAEVKAREEHCEFMKMLAGVGDGRDKETYKVVNGIMKPLLRSEGYRSLAEFEQAHNVKGNAMAWPQ